MKKRKELSGYVHLLSSGHMRLTAVQVDAICIHQVRFVHVSGLAVSEVVASNDERGSNVEF